MSVFMFMFMFMFMSEVYVCDKSRSFVVSPGKEVIISIETVSALEVLIRIYSLRHLRKGFPRYRRIQKRPQSADKMAAKCECEHAVHEPKKLLKFENFYRGMILFNIVTFLTKVSFPVIAKTGLQLAASDRI